MYLADIWVVSHWEQQELCWTRWEQRESARAGREKSQGCAWLWAGSKGRDWGLCYHLPLHPVMCPDTCHRAALRPRGLGEVFPGEGGRDTRGMRWPQPGDTSAIAGLCLLPCPHHSHTECCYS